MNNATRALMLGATLVLAACGSTPQERAAEADAVYKEEKARTLQEYKSCVKEANGDEQAMKQCDALLKAIEVLEKD